MSVVVSIEELEPCRKQLRIEVPAPAVDAETQRVTARYRRQANLPGFRKGKVPLEVIRKRFQDEIEREVVESLVPRYWRQAQAEKELDPLMPPEVSDVELEPGARLSFSATVEVRPSIELKQTEGFDLPNPEVEPTREEVNQALEDLRRSIADWVEADRPAAQGDRVEGRLLELTEEAESAEPNPVNFEVGDPNVWEELSLAVIGAAPGAEREFERREGSEGEPVTRRLKLIVDAVKERDLPPLDDQLAAKLGQFDSVEALREDVEAKIGQAKVENRRRQREQALLNELRRLHPIELPGGVVEREIERLLEDYAHQLSRGGVDLEKTELDWKKMAGQVRPQAEERVHSRLLLDRAAEQLEVELDSGEFESGLAAIARAQGQSTPALRKALQEAGRLEALREQMLRRKTIDRLLGEEAPESESIPSEEPNETE